jgi:hypothetical protein
MAVDDRDSVIEWMLRHQLARRNLTDAQRIQVTLRLKPFIEKKAKESHAANSGNPKTKQPLVNLPKVPETVNTRKELAETAGVSEKTFAKAEAVLASDNEEVRDNWSKGHGTSNARQTGQIVIVFSSVAEVLRPHS